MGELKTASISTPPKEAERAEPPVPEPPTASSDFDARVAAEIAKQLSAVLALKVAAEVAKQLAAVLALKVAAEVAKQLAAVPALKAGSPVEPGREVGSARAPSAGPTAFAEFYAGVKDVDAAWAAAAEAEVVEAEAWDAAAAAWAAVATAKAAEATAWAAVATAKAAKATAKAAHARTERERERADAEESADSSRFLAQEEERLSDLWRMEEVAEPETWTDHFWQSEGRPTAPADTERVAPTAGGRAHNWREPPRTEPPRRAAEQLEPPHKAAFEAAVEREMQRRSAAGERPRSAWGGKPFHSSRPEPRWQPGATGAPGGGGQRPLFRSAATPSATGEDFDFGEDAATRAEMAGEVRSGAPRAVLAEPPPGADNGATTVLGAEAGNGAASLLRSTAAPFTPPSSAGGSSGGGVGALRPEAVEFKPRPKGANTRSRMFDPGGVPTLVTSLSAPLRPDDARPIALPLPLLVRESLRRRLQPAWWHSDALGAGALDRSTWPGRPPGTAVRVRGSLRRRLQPAWWHSDALGAGAPGKSSACARSSGARSGEPSAALAAGLVTTLTRLALALSVGAVPVSGSGGDLSWNMEGATRHGARWGRQIALKAGTREHKRRERQIASKLCALGRAGL